ncbi:MAG TPA: hypothetical protein VEN47_00990 [Myxococcota bacterium]|nr:hypothetical protein [Myxococcota bacterium]
MNRSPLWLPLAAVLAFAPFFARAGADPNHPNDTNPLLADQTDDPCFAIDDVVTQTVFGGDASDPNAPVPFTTVITDPNDPAHSREVALCNSLCKKAGASCARFVKRAAACQTRWAADSATFKTKVNCSSFSGTDLKACTAFFQQERMNTVSDPNDPNSIQNLQTQGLADCSNAAAICQTECNNATP